MDGTRERDLYRLHAVMNDSNETDLHRRQAAAAIRRIKRKMRDPFIKAERERLIRATIAGDVPESQHISLNLELYEKQHYGRDG